MSKNYLSKMSINKKIFYLGVCENILFKSPVLGTFCSFSLPITKGAKRREITNNRRLICVVIFSKKKENEENVSTTCIGNLKKLVHTKGNMTVNEYITENNNKLYTKLTPL